MAYRILEGKRGKLGDHPSAMTPLFVVERPRIFAGQDIGERVAEFGTREEAERWVAENTNGGAS